MHSTSVAPSALALNKPRSSQSPQIKRSIILLIFCLTATFLVFTQMSTSFIDPDAKTSDTDAMRYSEAGAHFRKNLTLEQLEAYFQRREATLLATGKLPTKDERPVVSAANITSKYFSACAISTDNSVLHPSLKRGPDQIEILGRKNAKQPRDFDDVFSTIDHRRYYFHADRTAVQTVDSLGAGLDTDLNDATRVAKAVTEYDIGVPLRDIHVPIAYMRTTRQDGWYAIINLGGQATKGTAKVKEGSTVRRIVSVTRGYGTACETSFVRPREVVRLNILVPYSNRPHRIEAFLNMFADYFAGSSSNVADLVRIIVSTTKEEEASMRKLVAKHPEFSADGKERALVITSNGDEFGNFSRAVAVREASNKVPDDEVIFIADADLVLGGNFPQNCRVNIVRGSQVWFPVMFSLYPYGKGLSSRDGMWRRSSYGMACMYKSDFKAVGGFGPDEEGRFTGWGSEDVFLYNRFRDNEKYGVLRTLEPGLRHQWHGKECERNEHYVNCMRTVYMTIGSQDAIAKLMVDANVDTSNLTKNAVPV